MDRSAGMLRLSRQLDATAVVIRYDRRGYAKSSEVGSPYVLDEQIADLALVLDRHAPARSIDLAFGHSFGGNVVLGLAARRPELITRAVVYETPLSWFDWWPSSGAGGAAAQAATPEDAAEAFMRRLVGDERWERLPAGTRAGRRAEGVAMVGELNDLRRAAAMERRRRLLPGACCRRRARPSASPTRDAVTCRHAAEGDVRSARWCGAWCAQHASGRIGDAAARVAQSRRRLRRRQAAEMAAAGGGQGCRSADAVGAVQHTGKDACRCRE